MKKINFKYKIIGIYATLLVICFVLISINYMSIYDKVTIIKDRDEAVKKINMSIPIKIEIYNERWGEYYFEDENSIQKIWNLINEITKDSSTEENSLDEIDDMGISGTIYYLNGKKDTFQIGNKLTINNCTYYDSYRMPITSNLKNELFMYFYSSSNLGKIITSNNSMIFTNADNKLKVLDQSDKERVKDIIDNSVRIENNKEIISRITAGEKASYHIKIYIGSEQDSLIAVKSSDVINIDVYDNDFFIAQYMGDENGRHIYFKGKLCEVCEEL